ncbi:putative membrane protein [Bacilli bacterium PM5-9]|nr:putative membrane protein [Bacilli bacterium PM5-9]
MDNTNRSISKEAIESLNLKTGDKLLVELTDEKVIIEPLNKNVSMPMISPLHYLIPTIIACILFIGFSIYDNKSQIPLVGGFSIATSVIVLGFISGLASFLYFFIKGKTTQITTSKYVYWRNLPTIIAAFIVMLLFALLIFFGLMKFVFQGLTFDLFTSAFIFSLFVGVINYYMIYTSLTLSPTKLTNVLMVVIVGGVIASMLTNHDKQWWQYNLSFLGTTDATGSWQFNLTLMVSGLLMIALIDFIFVSLKIEYPKSKRLPILRVLLTLVALNLGAVGLFPYSDTVLFQKIHNGVATLLVYLVIIMIVGIKWLLPNTSKNFLITSYLIGATLLIAAILFQPVGYLSLTAFEIISFVLAFSWILLLLQDLQKLVQTGKEVYELDIN